MLTELAISNFAIIEHQSIEFHSGFNVISGETGAGKSIMLSALEFLLGGKISSSAIRTSADHLEVQALFDLTKIHPEIRKELPEIADSDELVITRTLPREGRGKILINGKFGTMSLLTEIVGKLVNICGQHHHTRLLDSKFHLELLDGFAGLENSVTEVRQLYREWSSAENELKRARENSSRSEERLRDLEHLCEGLRRIGIRPGMRAELEAGIKRMSNVERLEQNGSEVAEIFEGEAGLSSLLRQLTVKLSEMEKSGADVSQITEMIAGAKASLDDAQISLQRMLNDLEADPETLERMREELSELARYERMYREDDAALTERFKKAEQELQRSGIGSDLAAAEKLVKAKENQLMDAAKELSSKRKKAIPQLIKLVQADLAELNMADAVLKIEASTDEVSATGVDKVRFLLAANRGEEPKPLADIASGGELSRVTLVLKKVLRERSGVNVLIFDEVDAGVSGSVARSVGLMLKEIAADSQVICITHLPQVASLADRHLLVEKKSGPRTVSLVRELTRDEQVDEIARMLSGYTITETSRATARELMASK